MTLLEPDVSLTDLGLAIECAGFATWLIHRGAGLDPFGWWFIFFFGATGIAAFLGAMSHGFVPDTESILSQILWFGIFAAIGMAALACWAIGSRLLFSDSVARRVLIAMLVVFVIYLIVFIQYDGSYFVVIVNYLPAAAFLLIALIIAYRARRDAYLRTGIWGVALTFVAAFVQQSGIAVHKVYFNHNALYHVIQAVALYLIFIAAKGISRQKTP
ncbi:MAG: hypothetical protein O7G83_07840 [Proteobacteria bacterium]|nr:hypothetical protein [Pseudomonadota bacterium]